MKAHVPDQCWCGEVHDDEPSDGTVTRPATEPDVLSGVEPLTAEEEAAIRESFAAGMRLDRTAAVVFAREDIARLLATLDAARSVPVTEDGLDAESLLNEWSAMPHRGPFDKFVADRLQGR